jgi:Mg2+-importing ATPase
VGTRQESLDALLLSLATVSYFLGDIRAAVVIAIIVVLAIATAFSQEHRSNHAAAKLRAMVQTVASVKRRGANPASDNDQSNSSTSPWRGSFPETSCGFRRAT